MTTTTKCSIPSNSILERLQADLSYSPTTGAIRWVNPQGNIEPGEIAGFIDDQGYRVISFRVADHPWPIKVRAHKIAWLKMTGRWANHGIDHKDRDRANNKWANLRRSTPMVERLNKCLRYDNPSGIRGVWPRNGRWVATITFDYQKHHLGTFDTLEAAAEARYEAERLWYGRLCASSDRRCSPLVSTGW